MRIFKFTCRQTVATKRRNTEKEHIKQLLAKHKKGSFEPFFVSILMRLFYQHHCHKSK
ncbi:MAG: hypothetical protein ACJASL_000004 [Paraglaciecola sp.]|jgi:hypothetical protein